ncbi:MAG: porin family protein [Proteobacteria bacterium]|nr:porin family protein [Pseudomonadota bacterium]
MYGRPHAIAARTSLIQASFVSAVALTLSFAPASAADLSMPYKTPPAVFTTAFSWTGLYIGGQVGYSWGRDHLTEYFTATNAPTNFEKLYSPNGVVGGIYGGGNYQVGNTVLGLEADFEGANVTGGWTDALVGGEGTTKLSWQGSVRGRLGYAADKVLFYGTGGLAFGNVSHTYTNLFTGVAETTSNVRTGWTAGGGIEYAVTSNVLARVEYRYTDYGKSPYDSVTPFPGLPGTQEPRFSSVRAGIAYKF